MNKAEAQSLFKTIIVNGSPVNDRLVSRGIIQHTITFFCFVLLLYVPSQQLWSWRDGQFT